jgi:hypothetical protein
MFFNVLLRNKNYFLLTESFCDSFPVDNLIRIMNRWVSVMLKRAAAICTLALSLMSSPVGIAEEPAKSTCESRAAVLDFLSSRYSEAPVAMGMAKDGGLVEILTSGPGSTFTIIVTTPNGQTCMVAAGDSWENLAPQLSARRI